MTGESRIDRKPAKDFTELIVWQKAHQFVLQVYTITKLFPRDERFMDKKSLFWWQGHTPAQTSLKQLFHSEDRVTWRI